MGRIIEEVGGVSRNSANNLPLELLRRDFGLERRSHSVGTDSGLCLEQQTDPYTMAAAGAAMGYCQGLFVREGTPEEHTQHVMEYLLHISAPWSRSHELLLDNRREEESITDYINQAMIPLQGIGRVPVLITSLDPALAKDRETIEEIIHTKPIIHPGETILYRVVLSSSASIEAIADIMGKSLQESRKRGEMPRWWPLLQGEMSTEGWKALEIGLESSWKYANLAITPYTPREVLHDYASQVTVAQFLVGAKEGIDADGTITVPTAMCIGGKPKTQPYNLFDYTRILQQEGISPTCIVCGPSLPEWTVVENKARLGRYLSLFREASTSLGTENRERVCERVINLSA